MAKVVGSNPIIRFTVARAPPPAQLDGEQPVDTDVRLLLAAVAGMLLTAPAASATFPGHNGLIAATELQSDGLGDCGDGIHQSCGYLYGNVFTSPGRHRVSRCKPDYAHDCVPEGVAWSPNGHRIAYDVNGTTFIARPGGRHARKLVDGGHPAWSPDGSEIAYSGDRGIYRIRLRDRHVERITHGIVDDDPDWSSRGVIAFDRPLHQGDIYNYVFTVRPDGSGLRRFTKAHSLNPSWSPHGQKIAFDDLEGDVFIASARDGKPRRMPLPRHSAGSPAWSPDGRSLALGVGDGLAIVRPTGAVLKVYRVPWGAPAEISWQPRPSSRR